MHCKKAQKRISDRVDGVLSPQRERTLRAHLERCTSCRDYAARLERLQKAAANPEVPELSPEYWCEFTRRLERKLVSMKEKESTPHAVPGRRRALVFAPALAFLCALAALYVILRPQKLGDVYPLSQGETMSRIEREIGNDPGMAEKFNQAILESLDETVPDARGIGFQDLGEDPLFLESLTDEEIKGLEAEVLKEMKS